MDRRVACVTAEAAGSGTEGFDESLEEATESRFLSSHMVAL